LPTQRYLTYYYWPGHPAIESIIRERLMLGENEFLTTIESTLGSNDAWQLALDRILRRFAADGGTIHILGDDGQLHLKSVCPALPHVVVESLRSVPVGTGMAGLAVARRQPVNTDNVQTDSTGDVRPGARATGLRGSIVVPIMRGDVAVGALGIGSRHERAFTDDEAALLMKIGRVLARAQDRSPA
jgi:GAF domain-containing protein